MTRFLLLVVIGCAAAAGCSSDGPGVSPTAPEFKQPEIKQKGKAAGLE